MFFFEYCFLMKYKKNYTKIEISYKIRFVLDQLPTSCASIPTTWSPS